MKIPTIHWHHLLIGVLIGIAVGVGYCRTCSKHCETPARWQHAGSMRQHMVAKLSEQLGLDADQKKQLETIFDAKAPQMKALHTQMRSQFEVLRKETDDEIRKILRPDQQQKFEAWSAKMKERMDRREKFFKE